MGDYVKQPFPDLGPKTVNRLLQERLSNMVVNEKEVPVYWVSPESGAKKEIFPIVFIEFIDIQPAEDRQFSDIISCEVETLTDGYAAEYAKIKYPDAYMITYDVHLEADNLDDIVELTTEVVKRIPPSGYLFEIDGKFRLAVQRPGGVLNADDPEDMYFHRIYTYEVESYIFDYESLETVPSLLEAGFTLEVKDD